eukprot:TRINITY_DN9982_c0_g1_i4.p1 TRINITY_DN9982_c0_g1~~TRINITY_DN9982_c0_g1_i4.p1  ORF type:complete len:759 (+),score=141.49 TRINITY_DN9982_c0_g1_i4:123-2399(+)
MLTPTFSFSLNYPVEQKLAIIAKLDGINNSLVCVTCGGKLFIYNPNDKKLSEQKDGVANNINNESSAANINNNGNNADSGNNSGNENKNFDLLNLNKEIKQIKAARYVEGEADLLLYSSKNALTAYDVKNNSEKYNQEIQDGISIIEFGNLSGVEERIAIVGGNLNISGINSTGQEVYWNVTSDSVTAMVLSDVDGDMQNELIVGSSDNIIRVFKHENILYEINESSYPVCLAGMNKQRFCFGLQNGMVGVYSKKKRDWVAKSQIPPLSMFQGTFEKPEGYSPIIIGRQNGQIELRHDQTGEIIHKVTLTEKLSSLLYADLRMDGTQQIIAVTSEGNIKGYLLSPNKEVQSNPNSNVAKGELEQEFEELQKKKQILQLKAQSLEFGNNNNPQSQFIGQQLTSTEQEVLLPPNTTFQHEFLHNTQSQCIELTIQTEQSVYIKSAILFNEKLFDQESFFYCPQKSSNVMRIPLKVKANSGEKIRCKLIVSTNPHSQYFQVVDIEPQLAKFANFVLIDQNFAKYQAVPPSSRLFLKINERIPRYLKWLDQSFILEKDQFEALESSTSTRLTVYFMHIQSKLGLFIEVDQSKGTVTIHTDSIEFAGDIVQDLCSYMNVQEIESVGEFPVELAQFKQVLNQVENFRHSKMQITSEIADSINNIKTMIVKAEDSKILGDMNYVRKYYTEVMGENKQLFTELTKQQQNSQILMDGLREINSMINKAGNLRIGQFKTKVINLCRQAIKSNNFIQLLQIIENGNETM